MKNTIYFTIYHLHVNIIRSLRQFLMQLLENNLDKCKLQRKTGPFIGGKFKYDFEEQKYQRKIMRSFSAFNSIKDTRDGTSTIESTWEVRKHFKDLSFFRQELLWHCVNGGFWDEIGHWISYPVLKRASTMCNSMRVQVSVKEEGDGEMVLIWGQNGKKGGRKKKNVWYSLIVRESKEPSKNPKFFLLHSKDSTS